MQFGMLAICNTCNLQYLQFITHAICNSCNLQNVQSATCFIGNMCNLQHIEFATCAICNMCNLQHVQFATCAICNKCNLQHIQFEEYLHLHYWSEEGPTLWVGMSLTWGVRGGEYPVIPPIHWNGVALPWQRSLRTLKTLSNCKGFYNVFSAVERFLYLMHFFY